jgi:NitT/TauT family transport system substrate-binding protein
LNAPIDDTHSFEFMIEPCGYFRPGGRLGVGRHRVHVTSVVLALAAMLVLTGCGRNARPDDSIADSGLVPIVLQSDWFPQAEHGGFYQALARGFYADEGLAVEILPGGPGAMIKHKVVQGMAHFGMNRSDDLAVAVERGLPLVMVFAVMQRDPQALVMHAEQAAPDFEALDGRTVIASPGLNWITYLERRYSIRLNVQPHTYGLTHFLKDPTLVQQCFVTNEPFYIRQQGIEPVVLMLADSGYEPYHVVFTNRRFSAENPGLVRAFARASIRGWVDFLTGDPQDAFRLIADRNPQMTPEFMAYSRDTLIKRGLVTGRDGNLDRVGQLDTVRIQREIDELMDLGILEQSRQAADLMVNLAAD